MEGQFITDIYSFSREEPSSFNIDAVEDADLVLVSKTAHDELLKIMPKYETFFRILMTEDHIALQRRTANMISLTLEQRFQAFSKIYADLIQRVPQHMIASYMGISAETLSRIRSKLSGKN